MKITPELVDYLSTLSRLQLPPEEKASMAAELERLLAYMDALSRLDTEGAEPMSHVIPLKNVLRSDTVAPSTPRSDLLQNAPGADREAFLVPKAVD